MNIKTLTDWLLENEYSFSFIGDETAEVTGFASLTSCKRGMLTWVKKKENYEKLNDHVEATVAVVQEGIDLDIPNQIKCANSKKVFFAILHRFWGTENKEGYVGQGTFISEGAEVHPTAYIGYNCTIDGSVHIGAHTVVENNVSISHHVEIGENCIIHSGAVIGADGFGFAFDENGLPIKVEHFGGVIIGDRVEIGANTCIDRGTIENTELCDDVKIDNLAHIAHNVKIDKGALIVAGAIVCGSAYVGEESYVAPGGIIKNQLSIGANSLVGLGAVVTHEVEEDTVVMGVPAKPIRKLKKGDK